MTPENELEYKIIGSVLSLDGQYRQRIFAAIGEDFFAEPTAKEIYKTFDRICKDYPDTDYSVLTAALNKEQKVAAVSAMAGMISPVIAEKQLDDTLRAMKDLYMKRKIKTDIAELAFENEVTVNDLRQLVSNAEKLTDDQNISNAEKYLAHYNDPIALIPTGFELLDGVLGGGLMAGTLSTIGARPSTGKTTFAINIAAHNPERKILFFSLEMSAGMIYDRLISDVADIDYSLTGRHEVEIKTVKEIIGKYKTLTVVDDVSNAEKIADMIYSQKPEIVIVDFVQIITSGKKFVDNRQRIDYISQLLKQAAKATGCCVITLSQITRAGKDKPTMSDLKESGGLEQDSDYVLLLYRPYVNNKTGDDADPTATTVTLDKNKFGSTKELKYDFDGRKQRFTEIDDSGSPIQRPNKSGVTVEDDLPF